MHEENIIFVLQYIFSVVNILYVNLILNLILLHVGVLLLFCICVCCLHVLLSVSALMTIYFNLF